MILRGCVCLCLESACSRGQSCMLVLKWAGGTHVSHSSPTLINTVWPFRRQCLAFYNEFPSGAAGLNVTHSQLQFWVWRWWCVWVELWPPWLCLFCDDWRPSKQTLDASCENESRQTEKGAGQKPEHLGSITAMCLGTCSQHALWTDQMPE